MVAVDEEAPAPTLSFDDELLQRATRDAGQWAFGTVGVETWVLNGDRTLLVRAESGTWFDPLLHTECQGENCPYCRLTNPASPHFVPTPPLPPGVGIPGVLWTEASTFRSRRPTGPTSMLSERSSVELGHVEKKKVAWRNVRSIANDPDQPYNLRLQVAVELKLGWTAAVPFFVNGNEGIVIYWAREGVDLNRLMSPTNEAYLCSASNLIASAWALREPRLAVLREREEALDAVLRRVRTRLLSLIHMGVTLEHLASQPQQEAEKKNESLVQAIATHLKENPLGLVSALGRKIRTVFKKVQGANVPPPPAFTLEQACLSFASAFLTLMALTRFNVWLNENHGVDHTFVLGPFGALMTLQYGLMAAPASQPRNAILGQTLAITISLAISKLDSLELWFRQSLATSLAIGAMVKFGWIHPPAGAAALIFASGKLEWSNMGFMLVGNVIAIGSASLLNNLSSKRQYPTAWGVGQTIEKVKKQLPLKTKDA